MGPQGRKRVALKVGLVAAGLLLGLAPAGAWAQGGMAQGVLYEVLESPPAQAAPGGPDIPGAFPPGIGGRLAEATEAGGLQGIGTLEFLSGWMEIHAQSRIPVDPTTGAFGVGTVAGVFNVSDGNGGAVVGKLEGTLDLSWLNRAVPVAPTVGTWSTLGKGKTGGSFQGVFLLPFQVPGAPDLGWFYLELDPATGFPTGGVTPLQSFEFKDGSPLVKLQVVLLQ